MSSHQSRVERRAQRQCRARRSAFRKDITMARRRFWLTRLLVSLVAVAVLLNGAPRASRAADIDGNTWTSETFGESVTWDNSWFVTGEETGPWDLVSLTNGLTFATFVAQPDTAMSPEASL